MSERAPSPSQPPLFRSGSSASAPYLVGEACPTCDQPIPRDRFEEIKGRIEARQSAKTLEITSRLQDQFAREKANALEAAGLEAATKLESQVACAREEERRAAEVSGKALKAELDRARADNLAALLKVKEEAAADAALIRIDAVTQAQAAAQEKIAGQQRAHQQSEADLQARISKAEEATILAHESTALLRAQLEQMRIDRETAIEKVKQEANARVEIARQEATVAAEAAMHQRIAGAEQAKVTAEAKALSIEGQLRSSREDHAALLAQQLQEQREALERASTEAVNAEKSTAFEKELKLKNKVDELQRTLDNKTAEELGEGAELDLYDVLKGEFDGDRIERINKGQPGADILHTVVHNGTECGSIIYDSKNHSAWRNDFVTKLAADQMAAKADHAILSTRKFPAGARHLEVRDGVIVAAPSRVAAVVQIIRQHIVQTQTLRLSNQARTQKTAALYDFITSQRCNDLFARFDTHAEDLLDLQVREKKAHDAVWKRQGELLRSVQKVRAEVCKEIEIIIGGGAAEEQAANG